MNVVEDGVMPGAQYQFRPITNVNKAPPVQNTWYTVLEANNVLLQYLTVFNDTSTGGDGSTSVRITADGQSIATTMLIPDATYCSVFLSPYLLDSLSFNAIAAISDVLPVCYGQAWWARSMKVEVRTTGAITTQLIASARWWQL